MNVIRSILAIALLAISSLAAAGPIVDAAYVKQAIAGGAIVWDVRPTPAYKKGHIPGAVSIGDAGTVLREMTREDFVATDRVARILGDAGIDPARPIVVYGDRGSPFAYFGYFAIRYFGGNNVVVFHDGADGWTAAGDALDTAEARLPAVSLKLAPVAARMATTDEVVKDLKAIQKGKMQLVDVRTPAEFSGQDVRAIRGGHIPGAVNIPFEQNWKDPDTAAKLAQKKVPDNGGMSLRSADELKAIYSGLDPAKETIVYCQSGVRAAETAVVLEQIGFRNVRVYDSAWLGYAGRLGAPAADEAFFNVGAANGKIAALQKRVDELAAAVEQLNAQRATTAAATAK